MENVLVFVEHKGGQTRKVTYELATEARKIADALGGKAHAVVLGPSAQTLAQQLTQYPLDTIHATDDADVDKFLLDPTIDYIETVAKEIGPALILVPNTMLGRDVAGRLMARLEAGFNADVTDIVIDGGSVKCVSPKLGGSTI